jgi:hypothetical protein
MWLIAEYEAASLFSLKLSSATASGGKTLLVPTPYAIKMALLDAACRIRSVVVAEQMWEQIRDLQIALRPVEQVAVTNLFQKVLKPRRGEVGLEDPDAGPFQKTIGYREYAQWVGTLGIAFSASENESTDWLGDLLLNVNYLGKRGGFVQLVPPFQYAAQLPENFVEATVKPKAFAVNGVLQVLDDCGPSLTFAKANIYNRENRDKIKMGKERVTRHIVLPNFRLTRSSKSFSLYERSDK